MNLAKPPRDARQCAVATDFFDEARALVHDGLAVFPYSEVHLAETARLDSAFHRQAVARVWDAISGKHRFMDLKTIRGEQAKAVFDGRPVLFSPHLAVLESILSFEEELEAPDANHRMKRARTFVELAEYWRTLVTEQIDGRIRAAEAGAYSKGIIQVLSRVAARGPDGILRDAQRPDMELLSDLHWHALEQGLEDPMGEAFRFIQKRLLDVPCIGLECYLLERIAREFAKCNPKPGNPVKAKLDHTAYDVEAIAHFIPYCDGALVDQAMADRLRQNAKHLSLLKDVPIFSLRTLSEFTAHVRSRTTCTEPLFSLPKWRDEVVKLPVSAATQQSFFVAIYVPRVPDSLVRRMSIPESADGCPCEVLPGGSVKTWEALDSGSLDLARFGGVLEKFDARMSYDKVGFAFEYVVLAIAQPGNATATLIGEQRIPFGCFNLKEPSPQDVLDKFKRTRSAT